MDIKGNTTCAVCNHTLEIPVNLSVENMLTISVLLWTHEHPIECPNCHACYVPTMMQVDPAAVRWGIRKLKDALVQTPSGLVDVSGKQIL